MSDVLRAILAARAPHALRELKPYVPDPTPVPIRLDANEAPALLPTLSESERRTLHEALHAVEPAHYPDVRAARVRAALASSLNVAPEQLVLGVGSDEIISILLSTLARPIDASPPCVLVPTPSFVMYRISARVHGYDVVEVPLDADWDLDEAKMIAALREKRPAVVFLATPNNPTSGVYSLDRVERIVRAAAELDPPSIVVVDEAYLAFRKTGDASDPWAGKTGLDLLARDGNVVVFRTLSKIGLAALRVGWAVAHPLLSAEMEKVRLPYDLPSYSQAVAACALGPLAPAIDRHVASIVQERARLLSELRSIEGVDFGRTHANFVWMRLAKTKTASEVTVALRDRGILVRNFPAFPDRLRVSFGTRGADDAFLSALRAVL